MSLSLYIYICIYTITYLQRSILKKRYLHVHIYISMLYIYICAYIFRFLSISISMYMNHGQNHLNLSGLYWGYAGSLGLPWTGRPCLDIGSMVKIPYLKGLHRADMGCLLTGFMYGVLTTAPVGSVSFGDTRNPVVHASAPPACIDAVQRYAVDLILALPSLVQTTDGANCFVDTTKVYRKRALVKYAANTRCWHCHTVGVARENGTKTCSFCWFLRRWHPAKLNSETEQGERERERERDREREGERGSLCVWAFKT